MNHSSWLFSDKLFQHKIVIPHNNYPHWHVISLTDGRNTKFKFVIYFGFVELEDLSCCIEDITLRILPQIYFYLTYYWCFWYVLAFHPEPSDYFLLKIILGLENRWETLSQSFVVRFSLHGLILVWTKSKDKGVVHHILSLFSPISSTYIFTFSSYLNVESEITSKR